jgi:hypothetical protein
LSLSLIFLGLTSYFAKDYLQGILILSVLKPSVVLDPDVLRELFWWSIYNFVGIVVIAAVDPDKFLDPSQKIKIKEKKPRVSLRKIIRKLFSKSEKPLY